MKKETLELLTEKWIWFIIKALGDKKPDAGELMLAKEYLRAAILEGEVVDADIIQLTVHQLSDRRQLFPFDPKTLVQLESIDCEGLWKKVS